MPRLLPVLLLAGWAALPSLSLPSWWPEPWTPHLPVWAERWMYNPRERTAHALEALRRRDAKEARSAADTALRLAPQDPLARYNDGTAHLLTGDRRGAVPLLEQAARELSRSDRFKSSPAPAAAWYNLGNARLQSGDAAGAVEAYKQALRRAPQEVYFKHNLELALRQRDQEQKRAKSPQDGNRGDRQGDKESSDKSGADDPKDPNKQQKPGQPDPGEGQKKPQDQPQEPGEQPQKAGADGRPLRFRDQPEMSAQEAAALLQSVENLERNQRRRQAAQSSRQRAAKGKDW